MPTLNSELRASLEKAIVEARNQAEKAAEIALHTAGCRRAETLPVHDEGTNGNFATLCEREADNLAQVNKGPAFPLLVEEVAYAQWHRMFFARFLAENNLLVHPDAKSGCVTRGMRGIGSRRRGPKPLDHRSQVCERDAAWYLSPR